MLYLYIISGKSNLKGNFDRAYVSSTTITAKDTVEGYNIDGMLYNNGLLWINGRSQIFSLDSTAQIRNRIVVNTNINSPIVNFYVQNDTLFYYLGNTSKISYLPISNSLTSTKTISLKFPITDFLKLSNGYLLFELIPRNGSLCVKYIEKDTLQEFNNFYVDKIEGGAMSYSGKFLKNSNMSLFIPFYRDSIRIIDNSLKVDILKPIDSINQKIKINKVGDRFSLDANTRIIRIGAGISKDFLFLSSFVLASEESEKSFKEGTTIDIYRIRDKKYLLSFKIPNFNKKMVDDFVVSDNYLLAASYRNNIVIYDMRRFVKLFLNKNE